AGEPSATSDASGVWTITGVLPGTFKVRQDTHAGWTCSEPAGCAYTVDFVSGGSSGGKEFGDWHPGSASGNVYQDSDSSGSRDAGEPGLQNWTVYVDTN